jgi:hypothetical protein
VGLRLVFESSIVLKSLAMVVLLSWGGWARARNPAILRRPCDDGVTTV